MAAGFAAVVAASITPIGNRVGANPDRPRPSPSVPVRPYAADSLARVVIGRDLFRVSRRPSPVAYNAQRGAVPVADVPRPPRPVLVLVGIVAGSEPSAVIEGFPGIEGARAVRVGDEVSGLKVARIGKSDVRVTGMDTVWTLTVREPWR